MWVLGLIQAEFSTQHIVPLLRAQMVVFLA
jgi:hypothetical protein